jgi:hypothetical protein
MTEFIDVPGTVDYVYHQASPASPIDYLRLNRWARAAC